MRCMNGRRGTEACSGDKVPDIGGGDEEGFRIGIMIGPGLWEFEIPLWVPFKFGGQQFPAEFLDIINFLLIVRPPKPALHFQ